MRESSVLLLVVSCLLYWSYALQPLWSKHTQRSKESRRYSTFETHEEQVVKPSVNFDAESEEDSSIPILFSTQRNVDYVPLSTMLAVGDYKGADQFTRDNLIRLAGEEAVARQFVYWTEVSGIPDTDLATMERLWLQFSDGKFGFSVQKRIWAAEGGNFDRFIKRIGWTTTETTPAPQSSVPTTKSNSLSDGALTGGSTVSALLSQDETGASTIIAGTERLRRWFGQSEFIYDVKAAPKGHLPLTNAIRGTQLIKQLLQHPVWDQYDWENYSSIDWH